MKKSVIDHFRYELLNYPINPGSIVITVEEKFFHFFFTFLFTEIVTEHEDIVPTITAKKYK